MTKKERLDRVARLSSRLLDGLLTGPERVELNELLRGDPDLDVDIALAPAAGHRRTADVLHVGRR